MKTIADVLKKQKELKEELQKLDKVARAFQEICDHKWENSGHDSHYNYRTCSICGKEESY